MTNGDAIRQMGDEELSEWITEFCIDYIIFFLEENETPNLKICAATTDEDIELLCHSTLEWLSEEAQEDE